ncbi:hypothetical protein [Deinococcus navajonensis]|uniref:Uncharacterized protein n=1 Tax=Deinococcus navajonensis TaxID=309884 RepID=A0ABV8XN13_9DEIO
MKAVQQRELLPGHVLLCCVLATSGFRTVRPAPSGWTAVLQLVRSLGVFFAWSCSEDGWSLVRDRLVAPWSAASAPLIFSDWLLPRLRLDPLDLEEIASGGDVYRLKKLAARRLIQGPAGQ